LLGNAPDHVLQIQALLHRAVDREQDRALAEMASLGRRLDRPDHRGMVQISICLFRSRTRITKAAEAFWSAVQSSAPMVVA
jgi:hypothetical protein